MTSDKRDFLRDLDWSGVYARVPEEVNEAARAAFSRIRQRKLRRAKLMRAAVTAACVMLVAGGALLLLRGGEGAPDDRVAPPAPEVVPLLIQDTVYASATDEHYHVRADCPNLTGEPVALKLVTALEFEKTLCPDCGKKYYVDGQ